MKTETNKKNPAARTPFRILSGLFVLLAAFVLCISTSHVLRGELDIIPSLFIAVGFILEFGCITVWGDGLYIFNANRFKQNQINSEPDISCSTLSNLDDETKQND